MLLSKLEKKPFIETALLETFAKLLDRYRENPLPTVAVPGAKGSPRRRPPRRYSRG